MNAIAQVQAAIVTKPAATDADIIAALRAQIATLQAAPARKLTLKVSEKGAVSLYGMGRFPVTLYGTQWERLLNEADAIRAFLATNVSLLATKPTA